MPCEGGEAVMLTSETRLNNIAARVSTPILKNLCHVEMGRQYADTEVFFEHPAVKPGFRARILSCGRSRHEAASFAV
jgi:hypothetical protein